MDPFKTTYWNLMQVLSWVYLGDRELVRQAADDYSDHGFFMQEVRLPDGQKHFMQQNLPPPGPFSLLLTAEEKGGACFTSFKDARNELLEALRKGLLKSWGLKGGSGSLQEISAHEWADLKFYYGPPHAAPKEYFRRGASKWFGLIFKREDVLAIWPDELFDTLEEISTREEKGLPLLFSRTKPGREPDAQERASRALVALHPDGVPKQKLIVSTHEVNEWLISNREKEVSLSTVRRVLKPTKKDERKSKHKNS